MNDKVKATAAPSIVATHTGTIAYIEAHARTYFDAWAPFLRNNPAYKNVKGPCPTTT